MYQRNMHQQEAATQTCPKCRRSFLVLADEAGDHDCPSCGFCPDDNEEAADDDV